WQGRGPILADVNGDGTPDIVGRLRYIAAADEITLAAFDGASGRQLWESESLGTSEQVSDGVLGLAGDTLVFASPGQVSGFRVSDGKSKWKGTSLPEKVDAFCGAPQAGEVLLRLADDSIADLHL